MYVCLHIESFSLICNPLKIFFMFKHQDFCLSMKWKTETNLSVIRHYYRAFTCVPFHNINNP